MLRLDHKTRIALKGEIHTYLRLRLSWGNPEAQMRDFLREIHFGGLMDERTRAERMLRMLKELRAEGNVKDRVKLNRSGDRDFPVRHWWRLADQQEGGN